MYLLNKKLFLLLSLFMDFQSTNLNQPNISLLESQETLNISSLLDDKSENSIFEKVNNSSENNNESDDKEDNSVENMSYIPERGSILPEKDLKTEEDKRFTNNLEKEKSQEISEEKLQSIGISSEGYVNLEENLSENASHEKSYKEIELSNNFFSKKTRSEDQINIFTENEVKEDNKSETRIKECKETKEVEIEEYKEIEVLEVSNLYENYNASNNLNESNLHANNISEIVDRDSTFKSIENDTFLNEIIESSSTNKSEEINHKDTNLFKKKNSYHDNEVDNKVIDINNLPIKLKTEENSFEKSEEISFEDSNSDENSNSDKDIKKENFYRKVSGESIEMVEKNKGINVKNIEDSSSDEDIKKENLENNTNNKIEENIIRKKIPNEFQEDLCYSYNNNSKLENVVLNDSLLNASAILNASVFNIDIHASKNQVIRKSYGSYGDLNPKILKRLLEKKEKPFNNPEDNKKLFIYIKNFLDSNIDNKKEQFYTFNFLQNLENTKENIIEWMRALDKPNTLKFNEEKGPFQVMFELIKLNDIDAYDNIDMVDFFLDLTKKIKEYLKEKIHNKIQFIFVYENHTLNESLKFTSKKFNELIENLKNLDVSFLFTNVFFEEGFTEEDFVNFVNLNEIAPILKMTVNQLQPPCLGSTYIPYMIFKDNINNLDEEEKIIEINSLDVNFLINKEETFPGIVLQRDIFLLNANKYFLLDIKFCLNSEMNNNLINIARQLKDLSLNNWLTKIKSLSIEGNMKHIENNPKGSSPNCTDYILDEISNSVVTECLTIDSIYNFVTNPLILKESKNSNELLSLEELIIEKINNLIKNGVKTFILKNTQFHDGSLSKIFFYGKDTSLEKVLIENTCGFSKEHLYFFTKNPIINKNSKKIEIYITNNVELEINNINLKEKKSEKYINFSYEEKFKEY